MEKISVSLIQELITPDQPECRWISAASGLVKHNERIFVIADDRQELATFDLTNKRHCELFTLDPSPLPEDKEERKAKKNDWESLLVVQINADTRLLAVPSGSTEVRNKGVLINLHGLERGHHPRKIDNVNFKPFYSRLSREISELNIEGAVVADRKILFFQRGNGAAGINAVIEVSLSDFIEGLSHGVISEQVEYCIHRIDLGLVNNCRLGFTDACVDQDGNLWFLAVGETAASTYLDGDFAGAVVGRLDRSFQVVEVKELDIQYKPEGLFVEKIDGTLQFYIVTDSDDPSSPAKLFGFSF